MLKRKKYKTKENIKDAIADLLLTPIEKIKKNKGIIVSLVGCWGSGKSYRWENIISKIITEQKRKSIHISAFGKHFLSEFKLELMDKLLKSKNGYYKAWTGSILSLINFSLLLPITISIISITKFVIHDQQWTWHLVGNTFILLAAISICFSYLFYYPLIKFFSNKIIGVDHNNIDFGRLTHENDVPILCFDDIERIGIKDCFENILGFIDELKKLNFPILIIYNKNENNIINSEIWGKFKEKVITNNFNQTSNYETLKSVLKKYELDDLEKEYLNTVFTNLNEFTEDSDEYEENDFKYINSIKNNFRFIEHIINNIILVRAKITEYKTLDTQYKTGLLSYIGIYTAISFLEIPEKHLYDKKIEKNQSEDYKEYLKLNYIVDIDLLDKKKKRIGKLLINNNPSFLLGNSNKILLVKKLLLEGEYDTKIDIREEQTDVELFFNQTKFKHFNPWEHKKTATVKYYKELLNKITNSQKPFSSESMMKTILANLILCMDFCYLTFKESLFDDLLSTLDNFIKINPVPIENFLNYHHNKLIQIDSSNETRFYIKSGEFLNSKYLELGIKYNLDIIKNSEKFFDDYDNIERSSYNKIPYIYILITNKHKQIELSNMKDSDDTFLKYMNIVNNITYELQLDHTHKTLKSLAFKGKDYTYFIKTLSNDSNKILLANPSFPEKQFAEKVLSKIDKLLKILQ